MRSLPDPDISLRDASDFIFDSQLGRKALQDPTPPSLAVFLRELIQTIYRLSVSCHLPEFTDHGLGHLCSLVNRLSCWTMISAPSATPRRVVDQLTSQQAAILLLATLTHDIGMLSQRPEDMPPEETGARSLQDIPGWVRSTHITRMERLVARLFAGTPFKPLMADTIVRRSFRVARAHGCWPWNWARFQFADCDAGLAAMLAVADLLDEDSLRCDSATLLKHRYGSALNCAHWIRHAFTMDRVSVDGGIVNVRFARPPRTDFRIEPVFTALRNHYRLILLYVPTLAQVGAGLLSVNFNPPSGLPAEEADFLDGWWELPEFQFQSALVYHLLDSFLPDALLDQRRLSPEDIRRLQPAGLQNVDLGEFYRIRGTLAPRTPLEQSFHSLLGD